MRRIFRGRAGMALAFILGLLIASAGTATAAKLITGKQIKDGSIGAKDLSKAVQVQLQKAGVSGPVGAPGSKGEPGAGGVRGPKGDPGPVAVSINHTVSIPATPGTTSELLAQVGDLSVYGDCVNGGAIGGGLLKVASTSGGTATWFSVDSQDNSVASGAAALSSAKTVIAQAGVGYPAKNGQLIYRTAARTVTFAFFADFDFGTSKCIFGGTLVNAPAA